jgi:hypothetical protein
VPEAGLFERESTGDSGSCEPEIHNPVAPGYGPTSGLLDGRAVLARNQECAHSGTIAVQRPTLLQQGRPRFPDKLNCDGIHSRAHA